MWLRSYGFPILDSEVRFGGFLMLITKLFCGLVRILEQRLPKEHKI